METTACILQWASESWNILILSIDLWTIVLKHYWNTRVNKDEKAETIPYLNSRIYNWFQASSKEQ